MKAVTPTGREVDFGEEEIIVSKTDLHGIITYANPVFIRVAGYTEEELLGQPHSKIRHPDMPRCVFHLLWNRLQEGKEIFAFVKNMTRTGDHYWVLAHATPTFDENGRICGFHSNRRRPDRQAVAKVEPIYAALKAEEERHSSKRQAMEASGKILQQTLASAGVTYDQFVFSLIEREYQG